MDNPYVFRQECFWVNIPHETNKLDFFAQFIPKRLGGLLNDKPTILYTGIKRINFGKWLERWSDETWNALKGKEVNIFLYEPSTWYFPGKDDVNLGHYSEFPASFNEVVRSMELDSIMAWSKERDIIPNVITSDYNIREHASNYPGWFNQRLYTYDTYIRQISGPMGAVRYGEEELNTRFFCCNRRYAPHRHMMSAYLADKSANLSWPFEMSGKYDDFKDYAWMEMNKFSKERRAELKAGFKNLNENTHSIDMNHGGEKTHLYDFHVAGSFSPDPEQDNTEEFIRKYSRSCIAVVNETRFGQPTGYFSEKTCDPIRLEVPFVLVAPPHTLEYMNHMGFRTFWQHWDESYDKIEDHTERMEAIFKLLDWMNEMPFEQLKDLFKDTREICEHNREVIRYGLYNKPYQQIYETKN